MVPRGFLLYVRMGNGNYCETRQRNHNKVRISICTIPKTISLDIIVFFVFTYYNDMLFLRNSIVQTTLTEKLPHKLFFCFLLYRFTVDRLDQTSEFSVDLSLELFIEDKTTNFMVYSDARMPIPLCNEDATFVLPGDGTVKGFLLAIGENIASTAIEAVMYHLGILQYLSGGDCSVIPIDIRGSCMSGYRMFYFVSCLFLYCFVLFFQQCKRVQFHIPNKHLKRYK